MLRCKVPDISNLGVHAIYSLTNLQFSLMPKAGRGLPSHGL